MDYDSLTIDAAKLAELQTGRLRRQVAWAAERVPMYRERFAVAGITPDDIREPEDLHKVPFTVKDDLRAHYPHGILAVPLDEVVRFHASSGTTGTPTVVSYTQQDLDTWARLMGDSMRLAGVTPDDIVQNAYGMGLFTGGLGFHQGATYLGTGVLPTAAGNTLRQLKFMKDFGSTVLACTPSYAMFLSEAALKEGYDPARDFSLRLGLFGAEPWSEEARTRIQERLGIQAIDFYGMSELYGPGVAVECPRQNGLHIWSDEFLVETINPDTGEVLPKGTKGEMVFTMLTRQAMPLLRYRTRDLAVINYEPCACGCPHPRIMRVGGRSDDMLIIGGVNVFPSQVEEVLMSVPGVGDQYQIIIDRDVLDRLSLQVEVDSEFFGSADYDAAALTKRIAETLVSSITVRPRIELMKPGSLPRSEGKAQRVIDRR